MIECGFQLAARLVCLSMADSSVLSISPKRIRAGAGRSSPARAAWVRSPVARFLVWAGAHRGAGKTGVRLVYRYIYIPHTLQSSTTNHAIYSNTAIHTAIAQLESRRGIYRQI